jgi:hypothetical protein
MGASELIELTTMIGTTGADDITISLVGSGNLAIGAFDLCDLAVTDTRTLISPPEHWPWEQVDRNDRTDTI